MSEKRTKFLLRLPPSLFSDLQALAQNKGISLNSLIVLTLDNIIHPIEQQTGNNHQLQKELSEIDAKLKQLIDQRDDLIREDESLRESIAHLAPRNSDVQQAILKLLTAQPLSELRLAAELDQTPETIFLLLSNLEHQQKVKFDARNVKWYVTK